jgi:hypothetical protein
VDDRGPGNRPGAGSPVRVVLEFDPGELPSGRILRDGAPAGQFSGRLELYAAIERARDPDAHGKGPLTGPPVSEGRTTSD